jgi:hypothetical protein|tara:strand:- start:65 stop:598 length:534 start_codon:yes stop_codon:yes gene_type:complete
MLDEDATEFDIRIKDNFFSKEDFNYIKDVSKKISFDSLQLQYSKKKNHHVFFTTNASKEICDIVYKRVSNFFKIKILDMRLCQYSLVAKSSKVEVHNDKSEHTNFQTILYIDGDEDIHCGTGFYIEKGKDSFELNSHIGFRPNRIVSWSSNVYHAPLSFTDSYKKRISLITQYKIER